MNDSTTNNLETVIAKLQDLSPQQQQQVLEFVELLAAQSPQSSSPDRIAGLHPSAIALSDDFDQRSGACERAICSTWGNPKTAMASECIQAHSPDDPLPDQFWTWGNLD